MIDARLVPDEQEEITPGEAVAGMILNGLGFANRPLSLTPQFFTNKPRDLLLRPGVRAAMCNRLKLGRTLDAIHAYGCDLWLSELALARCAQEHIEQRFHHLATTRFSLSGTSVPESDEHAMHITHGYAKDHRPDLQQVVVELLVSQDGGVPLVSKSWDGNTSDTPIFKERAEALMAAFARAPTPRSLGADAKLSTEDTAPTRADWALSPAFRAPSSWCRRSFPRPCRRTGGIVWTRRPALTVWSCVTTAWPNAGWSSRHRLPWSAPRRASLKHRSVKGTLSHSHCCTCMPNVLRRLKRRKPPCTALSNVWRYPQRVTSQVTEHKRYAGKGRPPPPVPARRLRGRCTPRSDPLRRSLRPTSNGTPALSLGPICQPAM